MLITYLIIVLFGLTTAIGLYLSSLVFRNIQTNKELIVIHGFLTLTGFVLLIYVYPLFLGSTILFLVATSSGLILLYQDLKGIKFSQWLCIVHAISSLVALTFIVRSLL